MSNLYFFELAHGHIKKVWRCHTTAHARRVGKYLSQPGQCDDVAFITNERELARYKRELSKDNLLRLRQNNL